MKISHVALAVLFALPVAVVSTSASQNTQSSQTSGWRKPIIVEASSNAGADTPSPEVVPPGPRSCNGVVVTNSQGTQLCTLDLTFDEVPVDDAGPCGAGTPLIHITGSVKCGQSTCAIDFYRCGNSTAAFLILCAGHTIRIDPQAGWGGYATGATGCSNLDVNTSSTSRGSTISLEVADPRRLGTVLVCRSRWGKQGLARQVALGGS